MSIRGWAVTCWDADVLSVETHRRGGIVILERRVGKLNSSACSDYKLEHIKISKYAR
jgi:hypothetical protein